MPLPKHLKNKYNYLDTAPVNCMINSLFISRLNPVSVRQLYRLTLPIYNIFLEQKNELWRRCLPVRVVFIPLSDHMICVSTCTVLHIPNLYSSHLEILYLVDHSCTSVIRMCKVKGMHWNRGKKSFNAQLTRRYCQRNVAINGLYIYNVHLSYLKRCA